MTYQTQIEDWRAGRLAALKAEDGWLNLTDRIEIAPGRMTVGRAADNDVVISAGPDHMGVLDLAPDGAATFDAGQGPQPFQKTGNGWHTVHVASHRLDDDAGDLRWVLLEGGTHRGQIVVIADEGVFDKIRRHARRVRLA